MKGKKTILSLVTAVVVAGAAVAQHDKVRFTYERHTNIYMNEEGFFADTMLLKSDFAGMDYVVRADPRFPEKKVGFKSLASLDADEKRQLLGLLYHTNELLEGTYDRKKNITTINVSRNSAGQEAFYKFLKVRFSGRFQYRIVIDYGKGTILYDYPYVSNGKGKEADTYKINFTNPDRTNGWFEKITDRYRVVNLVSLDPELDPKITTGYVFNNTAFGVREIESLEDTVTLTNYTYE